MKRSSFRGKFTGFFIFIIAFITQNLYAQNEQQEIMFYQFRKVDPSKIEEFIKRETTYWSKVAEKGMANGKIEFWGLFEKVSGGSTDSPNFLFVNSYKDIDDAMKGEMWDATKVFPGVPMSKMETGSLSTTTKVIFSSPRSWEQSPKMGPDAIKYVLINFHHSNDPDAFIELENKVWQPFIKGEMEAGRTAQVAWGNQIILSPSEGKDRASTISVDLYSTFKDALMPTFAQDSKVPIEGLTELQKLTTAPRDVEIYRVVKIISRN